MNRIVSKYMHTHVLSYSNMVKEKICDKQYQIYAHFTFHKKSACMRRKGKKEKACVCREQMEGKE